MAEPKVLVDIIADGEIDGTSYEKGTAAELTPFQAQCAVNGGLAKYPKEAKIAEKPAAKRAPAKKRGTK